MLKPQSNEEINRSFFWIKIAFLLVIMLVGAVLYSYYMTQLGSPAAINAARWYGLISVGLYMVIGFIQWLITIVDPD